MSLILKQKNQDLKLNLVEQQNPVIFFDSDTRIIREAGPIVAGNGLVMEYHDTYTLISIEDGLILNCGTSTEVV